MRNNFSVAYKNVFEGAKHQLGGYSLTFNQKGIATKAPSRLLNVVLSKKKKRQACDYSIL